MYIYIYSGESKRHQDTLKFRYTTVVDIGRITNTQLYRIVI